MSEPFSFACPHCRTLLTATADMLGAEGPCPHCQQLVSAPPGPLPIEMIIPPDDIPPKRSSIWTSVALLGAGALATTALSYFFLRTSDAVLPTVPSPSVSQARPIVEVKPPDPIPAPEEPTPPPAPVIENAPPLVSSAAPETVPAEENPDIPPPLTPVMKPGETEPPPDPSSAALWPTPAPEEEVRPGVVAVEKPLDAKTRLTAVMPKGAAIAAPVDRLVAFLAAPTWEERLRYTLEPQRARGEMEAYYKQNTDGPWVPDYVEFNESQPTADDPPLRYYTFTLSQGDTIVPMAVHETTDGLRIDWFTFIECKDGLLAKFASKPQPGIKSFRVILTRTHYFEKDVPDQESKMCFLMQPPNAQSEHYAWFDKASPEFARIFNSPERTSWEAGNLLVVRLEWLEADNGAKWIHLRDVLADSWNPRDLPASER
jgi:hypothetical protein